MTIFIYFLLLCFLDDKIVWFLLSLPECMEIPSRVLPQDEGEMKKVSAFVVVKENNNILFVCVETRGYLEVC